jgi:hypothetical protein
MDEQARRRPPVRECLSAKAIVWRRDGPTAVLRIMAAEL